MFMINSHSQEISFDRIEKGGIRHIGTKSLEMDLDNVTYNFSLTVFSGANSKDYCLLISSFSKIEENCIVMLKLGNEEIVKLTANNLNIGQVDYPKYNPIIGGTTVSGILSNQKVDYYVSIFSLDDDLLNRIEEYGIIKIRVAYFGIYNERSWRKDRLGKYIKRCHLKLEEKLQKYPATIKSIESGF